jgi:hypothetical protein
MDEKDLEKRMDTLESKLDKIIGNIERSEKIADKEWKESLVKKVNEVNNE